MTCQTADHGKCQKTFKDAILDTCTKRNDSWAEEVRGRALLAMSDLHAADAQYHKDCLSSFTSNKPASSQSTACVDHAFNAVVESMLSNKNHVWNSVEVEELYQAHGGQDHSRRTLMEYWSDTIPDLLILSGNGIANILIFQKQASTQLKITATEIDDDVDSAITKLTKKITNECKDLTFDKEISDNSLPAVMAANIVLHLNQLLCKLL